MLLKSINLIEDKIIVDIFSCNTIATPLNKVKVGLNTNIARFKISSNNSIKDSNYLYNLPLRLLSIFLLKELPILNLIITSNLLVLVILNLVVVSPASIKVFYILLVLYRRETIVGILNISIR